MSTDVASSAAANNYSDFVQYVNQTLYAAKVGSVAGIPNALATSELSTALLIDPVQIQAYKESIAGQMNAQSTPAFEDLADRISDVTITTTAQGADTLQVDVIDPAWTLLVSNFITADLTGYLYPPIDVNFPSDKNMIWRLCQVRYSLDPAEPKTLLFEDRIVSALRSVGPANGGMQQGQPNQSLYSFFADLVQSTNTLLKLKPPITTISMLSPDDPNYVPQITLLPTATPLRPNPTRTQTGLTSTQQKANDQLDTTIKDIFGSVASTTIAAAESSLFALPGGFPGLIPGLGDGTVVIPPVH